MFCVSLFRPLAFNVLFNHGVLFLGLNLLLIDWVVLLLLRQVRQGWQAEERILLRVPLAAALEAVPVVEVRIVDGAVVVLGPSLEPLVLVRDSFALCISGKSPTSLC